MENTPIFPENSHEDDEDSKEEKKSSKRKPPRASFLELLQDQGKEDEDKKKTPERSTPKEEDAAKKEAANIDKVAEEAGEEEPARLPEESPEVEQEVAETAELDDTEEAVVAEQLVIDRIEEVESEMEIAPPDSNEELEVTAAAAFLDRIGDKLSQGEDLNEGTMDAAVSEVVNDLQLEEPTEPEEISDDADGDMGVLPEQPPQGLEDTSGHEQEDPDLTSTGGATTPPPAGSGSGGSSSSGGGTPPVPPTSPVGGSPFGAPPTPPVQPPQPQFEAATDSREQEDNHSHAPYVLAGGLLGYLIGRRRGRIKTEEKMKPVQKKLEENIGKLNSTLIEKEDKIRKLVVVNKEKLGAVNRDHVKERLEAEKRERHARIDALNKDIVQKPNETSTPPTPQPEVDPGTNIQRPPQAERAPVQPEVVRQPTPEAVVNRQLTDRQIIEMSKHIKINNQPLEKLYRAGQIEMRYLREAIYEYLQGGQYELLVNKYMKPNSQERDPFNNSPFEKDQQFETQNQKTQDNSLPTDLALQTDGLNQGRQPKRTMEAAYQQSKGIKKRAKDIPVTAKLAVGVALVIVVGILAAALGLAILGAL